MPDIESILQNSAAEVEQVSGEGSASASVRVVNVVNTTSGGSTSTVHVETSTDGEAQSQTYTNVAGPGESLHVDIATSTKSVGVTVHTNAQVRAVDPQEELYDAQTSSSAQSTTSDANMPATTTMRALPRVVYFFTSLPSSISQWFGNLFSFW